MATVTLTIPDEVKKELVEFNWVIWSVAAKQELLKKKIFETYLKTGEVSDKDWEFCEKIDWHPVDELPLKEEFIKKLEERRKGPFINTKRNLQLLSCSL